MALGLLTLITALSISAVAIYYSVAGLVAIFAAAALPIMIMGGVLEISKLVTAVWLHRYWKQATWWLKTYLSIAVVVLMLITSMGIFGFLSKAHIEQTSASQESVARSEILQAEIDRNLGIVGRAENRIRELESKGTGADANIQTQIDREQERIDKAFERIQPAIDEQNAIIAGVTKLFQDELDKIDAEIETLQGYIDNGEVKKAQQMIGASADGIFGRNTAEKIGDWKAEKEAERTEWLQKIQNAANSPTVVAARNEIQRLRKSAEDQVAQSQSLITRLQTQLANSDNADEVQKSIDEQNERVREASNEIERLTDEKIAIDAEYRKLEAEVGPIKYIAEFIYGEQADKNMLEEAVRWVIIVIIFVFDPLAVLLLIASQYTFEWRHRKDDNGGWLRQYEQARAQRIVDNPGYNIDDPKEDGDENGRRETGEEESQDAETLRTGQEEESIQRETSDDSVVASEEERKIDVAKSYIGTDDAVGDVVPEADTTVADTDDSELEQSEVPIDEPEDHKARREHYETLEHDEDARSLKQDWKAEHPHITLKTIKLDFIEGRIDELPWEPKKYIKKEGHTQITGETQPTEDRYIQNSEQSEDSIWQKIQKKDQQ
jgi:hypothetical protein